LEVGAAAAIVTVMRRGVALLQRLRSPARAEPAAWVAALAILLQTVLAGPLALTMAIGDAAGETVVALCHSEAPADEAPAPASTHTHESCAICQGALAPVLLAAAILVGPSERIDGAEMPAPAPAVKPDRPVHAYQSQGPPPTA
jgi:hypothetical protein